MAAAAATVAGIPSKSVFGNTAAGAGGGGGAQGKMVTSSKALASLKASTTGGSAANNSSLTALAAKGAINTRKRAALGDLSNIQVQTVNSLENDTFSSLTLLYSLSFIECRNYKGFQAGCWSKNHYC